MTKFIQFQVTKTRSTVTNADWFIIYALDSEGLLWMRHSQLGWQRVKNPGE